LLHDLNGRSSQAIAPAERANFEDHVLGQPPVSRDDDLKLHGSTILFQ
jgi:hypothetical protein